MRISFDPFGYQNFSLINEQLAVITVFHISLIREFVRASEHPDFSGQSGKKCPRLLKFATSGNRTRASRVAGENSTTEPTLLEDN